MSDRMPWCLQESDGAIIEQIKVAFDLEYFQFAYVAEVVLTINWPRPRIRPKRVSDFLALNDMGRVREVGHPPGVIEM
jgi:hypothetical protein